MKVNWEIAFWPNSASIFERAVIFGDALAFPLVLPEVAIFGIMQLEQLRIRESNIQEAMAQEIRGVQAEAPHRARKLAGSR